MNRRGLREIELLKGVPHAHNTQRFPKSHPEAKCAAKKTLTKEWFGAKYPENTGDPGELFIDYNQTGGAHEPL
jgi:hypothetical protein